MFNATSACELLVGLPAVNVLDVVEPLVGRLEITVESKVSVPDCPGCGERAWVKDRPVVELVDLTCFGRPVTLRWRTAPLVLPEIVVPGGVVDPRGPGHRRASLIGQRPGRTVGDGPGRPAGPGGV